MWDILDQVIIIPIICAFAYGLIRQIQETINLTESKKYITKNLVINILCSVAYSAFLIFFILNIVIALTGLNSTILTSRSTGNLCTISLAVFVISKYCIVDKN